jgi:periplasmic divalent cation tolerance protein
VVGPLGVFVYGTLRPGGWNHEQWLAPLLAAPCRPARITGMALHHHDGLPAVVPGATTTAVVHGDVATLRPDGYADALAVLDFLEGTAADHYRRVQVTTDDGEDVWVWVAGPAVAAALGPETVVAHGDWLAVPGAIR